MHWLAIRHEYDKNIYLTWKHYLVDSTDTLYMVQVAKNLDNFRHVNFKRKQI